MSSRLASIDMSDGSAEEPARQNHDGAQESTTLVTFLLTDLRKANHIELLGSWDNFSAPYPMRRDTRRGRGYWRGIHTFKNIICDGDLSRDVHSSQRNGALLTGGLYWYYYRINGDTEYYNPAEPSTNNCPLLPGQTVNVLEVPIESPTQNPLDISDINPTAAMTWNPEDRWAPLKRKRPTSRADHKTYPFRTPKHRPQLAKLRKLYTSVDQSPSIGTGKTISTRSRDTESEDFSHKRPRSCPSTGLCKQAHGRSSRPQSRRASTPFHNPDTVSSRASTTASRDRRSRAGEDDKDAEQLYELRPRRISRQIVQEFLQTKGSLPSRARTALEPNTAHALPLEKSQNKRRPSSAPSMFACPESATEELGLGDSEKLGKRMRSLRLKIACAKLRKLQMEQETSDNLDASWILDSLPNTFSEVLQNFGGRREDGGSTRNARESIGFDEFSTSPPQLSFSSRQSMLWTPETASVLGTSHDSFGPSIRMAIRQSGDFQLAVHNALDLEQSPPPPVTKAADRLGVRFSGIGLDSQETIRPPGARDAAVKPLDPAWNPFDTSTKETGEADAAEQRNKPEFLPDPTAGLNTSGLMDDLGFLGKAIG